MEEDYSNTGMLNKEQYEMVDQDLRQSVMDAEISLPRVPKVWWTPEIGYKFRLLQYWRATLSFARNKMEGTMELGRLKKTSRGYRHIPRGREKRHKIPGKEGS
eukprot:7326365-Ditylum_brightwellii.AAC.1